MSSLRTELEKLPMFLALSSDQLNDLLAHSQPISLKKNHILFHMGDPSSHFYYLRTGQIKIARSTQNGLEKVLTIVHPGQLFAEAVMFLDRSQFPATAVALESCEVIGFKNQVFTGYLRESHALSMAMLSNLTQRLHKQIIEIENLTMQNANYRLLNFINGLIPAESSNFVGIELPGPKSTIASRLSIAPETFSRALHALSEQNLITLQGKGRQIDIPDVKKFKHYFSTQ